MVITLFLILKTGTQNWTPYQTGERLAFFPIPPNAQDAWHGYSTNSQYIGDELVEHWYSINVISKGIYRKLLKHIL